MTTDRYPETPGYRRGPNEATSREAAHFVAERAPSMMKRIEAFLKEAPATPEELTARFLLEGETVLLNSVRARATQLYKLGIVRPSGTFGKGESGKVKVIRWEIIPEEQRATNRPEEAA